MTSNRSQASARPDYSLTYEYRAGSMPPPFHHEYTIRLGPHGAGEILYSPDYPNHHPPVWRETFTVPQADWVELCAMVDKTVLHTTWSPTQRHAVGGSQEWLEVAEGDTRVSVPAQLEERDEKKIRTVYDRLRALVPDELWKSLQARREAYEDNYK